MHTSKDTRRNVPPRPPSWTASTAYIGYVPPVTCPSKRAGASPEPATEWHIHRRVKIHSRDWRFQVAQIGAEWWVNKVGTYGMASAQLYWGRMAALLSFPRNRLGLRLYRRLCLATAGSPSRLTLHRPPVGVTLIGHPLELEEDGPRTHEHVAWVRHRPIRTHCPDGERQTFPGNAATGPAGSG